VVEKVSRPLRFQLEPISRVFVLLEVGFSVRTVTTNKSSVLLGESLATSPNNIAHQESREDDSIRYIDGLRRGRRIVETVGLVGVVCLGANGKGR
jgi:hypothetical protein